MPLCGSSVTPLLIHEPTHSQIIIAAGLFNADGRPAFGEARWVPRLYALIARGLIDGDLAVDWLNADCAFGLLTLRRAWISYFNRLSELERFLGLACGRGFGGERHRSAAVRKRFVRVLGAMQVCSSF